jgi:hypothetical protein
MGRAYSTHEKMDAYRDSMVKPEGKRTLGIILKWMLG